MIKIIIKIFIVIISTSLSIFAIQPTVDIKDKIVQIWQQGDLDSAITSAQE